MPHSSQLPDTDDSLSNRVIGDLVRLLAISQLDGQTVLVDGFKRLRAARTLRGQQQLMARFLEADEQAAKAAIFNLNRITSRPVELEEAWIIYALVIDDGLQQTEVAQMLGRHKSWVNRRLALIERLCNEAREALRLGLMTPTQARHLTRLPRGNQLSAMQSATHAALTSRELSYMVDLLLASSTVEQTRFVLEKPRQAIAQSQDHYVHCWDPRLSTAGNRLAKRLGFLLDSLSKMATAFWNASWRIRVRLSRRGSSLARANKKQSPSLPTRNRFRLAIAESIKTCSMARRKLLQKPIKKFLPRTSLMSPKKKTNSPDPTSPNNPRPDYRATILSSMETLKIKMAPEELDTLVRDATEKGMSPWELLDRFLKSPAHQSVQRSIQRRIANAGLPTTATLEAFDWEFNAKTINKSSMLELASGEFIKRRDNLAFVGQSGLGKYFGDPALVMALLDRVSDNAIIFRFEGKSYRKSRTKQAT